MLILAMVAPHIRACVILMRMFISVRQRKPSGSAVAASQEVGGRDAERPADGKLVCGKAGSELREAGQGERFLFCRSRKRGELERRVVREGGAEDGA